MGIKEKKGAKCLDCKRHYNIFLLSGGAGRSFEDYRCPECKSTKKEEAEFIVLEQVVGWHNPITKK